MQPQTINEIEKALGYVFKDKSLIEAAFTHSSYAKEHNTASNERMEFLGDGVLNFVVADFLYTHRNVDEGIMSQKRSKIVSREPLSKEVERLGLMQFLRVSKLDENSLVSTKFKSNIYEAAVAAVYLDGGLEKAKEFIVSTLIKNIKRGDNEDYKTKLQIETQEKCQKTEYKDEALSEVPPLFRSIVFVDGKQAGAGKGSSKKAAQQQAAKNYFLGKESEV